LYEKECVLVIDFCFFLPAARPEREHPNYGLFPSFYGNRWTYTNATGKITDFVVLANSMLDPKANDGTSVFLFEQQIIGMGTISSMKSIKGNKVVVLITKDILGRYHENTAPYPVELAPAGQEWRYNNQGDNLRYKASKSSCSFDDKLYTDCILIEERIVDGNQQPRRKRLNLTHKSIL
jgi:hypothetical protein